MVYAKVLRYKPQLDVNGHCSPDRPDVAHISHQILYQLTSGGSIFNEHCCNWPIFVVVLSTFIMFWKLLIATLAKPEMNWVGLTILCWQSTGHWDTQEHHTYHVSLPSWSGMSWGISLSSSRSSCLYAGNPHSSCDWCFTRKKQFSESEAVTQECR